MEKNCRIIWNIADWLGCFTYDLSTTGSILRVQHAVASGASVGDVVHRVDHEWNPAAACGEEEQNDTQNPLHLRVLNIDDGGVVGLAVGAPDVVARRTRVLQSHDVSGSGSCGSLSLSS